MKDRRITTFEVLLGSRERVAKALERRLIEQNEQYAALIASMEKKYAEVEASIQDQRACEAVIDEMINGHEPVRLDDINARRQHHETLMERRVMLEGELEKIQQSVWRKEEELRETRRCILKNDAQMDSYKQRLQAIECAIENAREETLNDDIEDVLLGRHRVSRHDHKPKS